MSGDNPDEKKASYRIWNYAVCAKNATKNLFSLNKTTAFFKGAYYSQLLITGCM